MLHVREMRSASRARRSPEVSSQWRAGNQRSALSGRLSLHALGPPEWPPEPHGHSGASMARVPEAVRNGGGSARPWLTLRASEHGCRGRARSTARSRLEAQVPCSAHRRSWSPYTVLPLTETTTFESRWTTASDTCLANTLGAGVPGLSPIYSDRRLQPKSSCITRFLQVFLSSAVRSNLVRACPSAGGSTTCESESSRPLRIEMLLGRRR